LNELIGVVAAKREVEARFREEHPRRPFTWLFLDDFAHWFTKKMPDLLFVALMEGEGGRPALHAEVVEAKCVGASAFEREAKDAQRQVAQGVDRLARAWAPGHA